MSEKPRLRVFEDAEGKRYVRQLTQAETTAYLAANDTVTLVR